MKVDLYKKEKGQSMVEFAFTIVIMIILLVGIVDIGRAFFVFMSLRDAAQEGALYGSTYPNDCAGMENRTRTTAMFPVDLSDTTTVHVVPYVNTHVCTGADPEACADGLNSVTLKVGYDFPITTPFLGTFVGSQTFVITATVNDTILRPPCY